MTFWKKFLYQTNNRTT